MDTARNPALAPRDSRPIPDFFLVGQPKSGSTALYEMLRQHPAIYMPDLKEPDFFSTDLRRRFPPRIGGPLPQTMDEYLNLFVPAEPGQIVGEASVFYLRSHVAAAGIARLNPEARIIVVLREPAQLLRSMHLQVLQAQIETVKDLRTALALEPRRRLGQAVPRSSHQPQLLLYSEHVRYVDQLRRFSDLFPRDQMAILLYDDFLADNHATLQRLFRFLGVDDSLRVAPSEANASVLVRSATASDLLHRVSVGRGPASRVVKQLVKLVSSRQIRRRLLGAGQRALQASPPPVDPDLMMELRLQYAPEVARLSDYLGRDVESIWHPRSLTPDRGPTSSPVSDVIAD